MESPSWRHCWQWLDVSAFDLPGGFPDFPLSDHRTSVWAESDATATARLKIHYCHAQVIRVRKHLNLKVDSTRGIVIQDICAKTAPEVGDLVWVCHCCDLGAAKRSTKCGNVCAEVVEPALPVDACQFPPTNTANFTPFKIHSRLLEDTFTFKLQTMENPGPQSSPRPNSCTIQLPQQPTRCVGTTQCGCVEKQRQDEVWAFCEFSKRRMLRASTSCARCLPRPGLPADRPCIERPRSCLERTHGLECPMMRLHCGVHRGHTGTQHPKGS
mmetsp:Transcript_77582/g.153895  ORF Transcript_77582/g.153895 Transcript_77582/m.153895 type:complete len:270 (+) Transcript_77582:498-1307(+)